MMMAVGLGGISGAIGWAYYNRDKIDSFLESCIVKKVKSQVKHELNQEHVIEMCDSNFKRVFWRGVLENPAVQNKTVDLLDQLLKQERTEKIIKDLMIKGTKHPPVVQRLSIQALGRTEQFVEDPFTKDQMLKSLINENKEN